MSDRISWRSYIVQHPVRVYSIPSLVLAACAISPTPTFAPLVALLTCLRLSTWSFYPRKRGKRYLILQVILVSLASAITQLAPSLGALSTPTTSIVVLSGISLATSLFSFVVINVASYATRWVHTPWPQLTLFPAIWATAQGSLSQASPVGQLATWNPVVGLGPYVWLRQVFGQWGINWVAAAWAVVFSETLGDWLVQHPSASRSAPGSPESYHEPLIPMTPDSERQEFMQAPRQAPRKQSSQSSHTGRSGSLFTLAAVLLVLMVPSYFFPSLPLPPYSPDTTPFNVACALPVPHKRKHDGSPNIDDFLLESKQLQASADVILWPESALRFDTPSEKKEAFAKIQLQMNNKKYFGIGFEEYVPPEKRDGSGRGGIRRNGFALLGKTGEPLLEYSKRMLVPIAESYSLTPGIEPPSIFHVPLEPPKFYNKSDWAPDGPPYVRSIPLTASICLDFSSDHSFTHLDSRPALILAPAKTWHGDIGYAMWEQAKARAAETGSIVLWCDGGEGGVSGVAGGGYDEVVQVGPGSWFKTLGVRYPFNEHRTIFSFAGDSGAFVVVWTVWLVEMLLARSVDMAAIAMIVVKVRSVGDVVREWRKAHRSDEERPLLS